MRRAALLLAVLIPCVGLAEARNSDLDKAARLVFDQKYEAAARALEVAWRQTGNKRDVVLRILELQGVVYAQLNEEKKARQSFQQLLSLDPRRELGGKYNVKVMKPFELAQEWARENPPLEASAEPAAIAAGTVVQIAVKVKNDGLKLARKVRFYVRPEGGKWAETDVDIQGAYASAGTEAAGLEWYAELLGDREMVLAGVASQRQPVKEGTLAPKEPKPKPPDRPEKEPDPGKRDVTPKPKPLEDEPEVVQRPDQPLKGGAVLRGAGVGLVAGGAVSLLAGTIMGVLWRGTEADLKRRLDMATFAPNGALIEPSQQLYFAIGDRLKTQAIAANTLWAIGGVFLVTGAICWLVGREETE